ncbi:MAG: DoxX family membrane protein [bacterium]|nr:DoxX family membrane protein [bacterium]
MHDLYRRFNKIDTNITEWMAHNGILLTRVALGIIFFWFGFLKFFPGLSPAQELATSTIDVLTFGLIPAQISIPLLASWESLIGLGLISGIFLRLTLLLLFLQMGGTLLPILFFPEEIFTRIPYAPTLEGQYIIKNLVLIASGIVVGATARGGKIIADPKTAKMAQRIEKIAKS